VKQTASVETAHSSPRKDQMRHSALPAEVTPSVCRINRKYAIWIQIQRVKPR